MDSFDSEDHPALYCPSTLSKLDVCPVFTMESWLYAWSGPREWSFPTNIFSISLSQDSYPCVLQANYHHPCVKDFFWSIDYWPVALKPINLKCFEHLDMRHINWSLLITLDQFQYVYPAISGAIQLCVNHLDKDVVQRLLLSMQHNHPTRSPRKAELLGTCLKLDFLTGRPVHQNQQLHLLHHHCRWQSTAVYTADSWLCCKLWV